MMVDTAASQIKASSPNFSTWVDANAGSGKTRVLIDRVARLLFQGVRPEKILCLTYTRAAANEMQMRLFERLGTWSMASEDALRRDLQALGEDSRVSGDALRTARRAFATAIEAPGGLKIQTIHAFAAGLLRRFPLEAGVSPMFRELDDIGAAILRQEVLAEIATNPDTRNALNEFLKVRPRDLGEICKDISRQSDQFEDPPSQADVFSAFGLPPDVDGDHIEQKLAVGPDDALAIQAVLAADLKRPSDKKFARALEPLGTGQIDRFALPDLAHAFLVKSGESPIERFLTQGAMNALGPKAQQLQDLQCRVFDAFRLKQQIDGANESVAFLEFARIFLELYFARKTSLGVLDFDDQIRLTRRLLSSPSAVDWVLYKLDGGIEHVLVDEAQDTSPQQWQIIRDLTQEILSGTGQHQADRTIFAVGDPKQSIYSFQGAEPEAFHKMRANYRAALAHGERPMKDVRLDHSFRSAPAILSAVDAALAPYHSSGLGDDILHRPYFENLPGRVDIWPIVEPFDKEESEPHWSVPYTRVTQDHPARTLARSISMEIEKVLANGEQLTDSKGITRPINAGDFLILVQRRSGHLFREILTALKSANLPVGGADRIILSTELAVRDIISLLTFLNSPQDDLSLAVALRSPLLGASEADLYSLAADRPAGRSLWQTLVNKKSEFSSIYALLAALLNSVDFKSPYELIDSILTEYGGLGRILARLGPEAEESVDALLALALSFERSEPPSLTRFLAWFDAEEVIINRQMDSSGGAIRVMTVHGAKGLEAPIVILPDTSKHRQSSLGDDILRDENGPHWKGRKGQMTDRSTVALRQKRARAEEERMRLLYVAMTRAESWLIICGAENSEPPSWHQIVEDGLKSLDCQSLETPTGVGLRFASGKWPSPKGPCAERQEQGLDLPEWLTSHLPSPQRPTQSLSPTDLPGPKALPSELGFEVGDAKDRGNAIHNLLEYLPSLSPPDWRSGAISILGGRHDFEEVFAEAEAVLTAADLREIFGPKALAEVELAGRIPELQDRLFRGRVDRLLVDPNRVLAVDFKTNTNVPASPKEVPDGLLRQMGAYGSMLSQIYPKHRVELAIVWTRTRTLMPLSHEIVRNVLMATPLP